MSSVTRFLKQVDPAAAVFSIGGIVLNASTVVYEFVPLAGNVVGNYPPGYVVAASAALQLALSQAQNAATAAGQSLVVRDMGKTIFAPVTDAIPTAATKYGRFRQVQVLLPQTIYRLGQGFIGGAAGTSFGVLGAAATPDLYTNYLTLYIAVPVGGVAVGANAGVPVIPGGMM
jgi:hypothetical protein